MDPLATLSKILPLEAATLVALLMRDWVWAIDFSRVSPTLALDFTTRSALFLLLLASSCSRPLPRGVAVSAAFFFFAAFFVARPTLVSNLLAPDFLIFAFLSANLSAVSFFLFANLSLAAFSLAACFWSANLFFTLALRAATESACDRIDFPRVVRDFPSRTSSAAACFFVFLAVLSSNVDFFYNFVAKIQLKWKQIIWSTGG